PQGPHCDIGAFERIPPADTDAPVITITTDASDAVAASGWYTIASSGIDGVLVNVSAADASAVTNLTCTDSSTTVLSVGSGSGSFVLTDGIHSISCTATDSADNSG